MKLSIIMILLSCSLSVGAQETTSLQDKVDNSWSATVVKKLRINYFSELLGPGFDSQDGNIPDVDGKGNAVDNPEPTQLWNQISIGWHVTDNWRLIFNPRFTAQIGNRDDLPTDNSVLRTEDFLAGIQGTLWKSGAWSVWVRPAYRLPTSRASRDSNWNGQVEWLHIIDRAPGTDTKWGVGMWTLARAYVPTDETTSERWRLYNAPYVTYTINDKWRAEVFYENEIQHNQPRGKRDYNYSRNTLQSGMTGVTYTISPSLSIFPFIRYYTVRKLDPSTMGLGAWIQAALF